MQIKPHHSISSLLLALLLATPLHATTLSFSFGDNSIAGVRVTQTESDGTVTVYTTNSNGQITLPTTQKLLYKIVEAENENFTN
ncbi:MAG TPA: hypothetical protein DCL68_03365 [Gammaproteobacteria bacterium]|nr:hypothetical protein [Gammaproteobacteria bacterium]